MRLAEERRSASIVINSSIRWVLAGAQVDCSTKQSQPRTFSPISTLTSPSLNVPTWAFPTSMSR
jgi:hypothetical protein